MEKNNIKVLFLSLVLLLNISIGSAKNIDLQKKVANIIHELKIPHKEIVMRQVILESGHFTSYAAKNRNNILGMYGGFKVYDSFEDCLADYKKKISKRYSEGNYYSFLKHIGYCECPNYIEKLKSLTISDEVKKILKNGNVEKFIWKNFEVTNFYDIFDHQNYKK